jgi:hypothetical protein
MKCSGVLKREADEAVRALAEVVFKNSHGQHKAALKSTHHALDTFFAKLSEEQYTACLYRSAPCVHFKWDYFPSSIHLHTR